MSKGGLLYHCDKHSLPEALAVRAIEEMDSELNEVARRGRVAATWLLQSVPDDHHLRLYRGMMATLRLTVSGSVELPVLRQPPPRSPRWRPVSGSSRSPLMGTLLASIAALALLDSLNPAAIAGVALLLLAPGKLQLRSAAAFVVGAYFTVFARSGDLHRSRRRRSLPR